MAGPSAPGYPVGQRAPAPAWAVPLALLAALALDPAPTAAARDPRLGLVDASLLFIVHPAMRDFVVEERNFTPPGGSADSGLERKVLLRQRGGIVREMYAHAQELLREAGLRLSREEAHRAASLARLTREQGLAFERYRAARARGGRSADEIAREYRATVERLETDYWEAVRRFDAARRQAARIHARPEEERIKLGLVPPNAMFARLETILADVHDAIETARIAGGISLVLNSGAVPPRPKDRTPTPFAWPSPPSTPGDLDNWYRTFVLTGSSPDLATRRRWLLSWWLRQAPELTHHYQGSRLDRLVLAGGRDITVDALRILLTRHGVPPAQIEVLARFVGDRARPRPWREGPPGGQPSRAESGAGPGGDPR